jgi:hypothetical protein
MTGSNILRFSIRKLGYCGLLLGTVLLAVIPAISADDRKTETIDARAMGTSTQNGSKRGREGDHQSIFLTRGQAGPRRCV